MNEQPIEQAANKNEVWKIVRKMANPWTEKQWMLKQDDREIRDERKVAEFFNKFFTSKTRKLKENIGREYLKVS
jgi:hypothetical protein